MALDELVLITNTEVRSVRYITENYDATKFALFAREIQRDYVMPLLGTDLYIDLLDNVSSQIYVDLLDGKDYQDSGSTVRFQGLKLYIIYMWLWLYAREGGVQLTESGREDFIFENSSQTTPGLSDEVISQYFSSANAIADQIKKFLEDNSDDYPEYKSSEVETKQTKSFSFSVLGESHGKSEVL